ncbi:MAG: hypothetical protein ABJA93_02785 [Sporichthyaceae bacterium]
MTTKVDRDRSELMLTPDPEIVDELTVSVQKHLGPLVAGRDVSGMVFAAVDELTPLTVRNYLPVLVERRIRSQIG